MMLSPERIETIHALIEAVEIRKSYVKDKEGKKLAKRPFLNPSKIKTIFDLDSINDNDNVLVIDSIEVACQLRLKGIENVTFIQYGDVLDEKQPIESEKYLGYTYINIEKKYRRELGKFKMSKDFDVILANPPYEGNSYLHQKFFNFAFDLLRDGGVMTFLQPASPYITAFEESRNKENAAMREIVVNNYSKVRLVSPKVFDNAIMSYPLSVTEVKKNVPGFKGIDVFTDLKAHCTTFKNVGINDVNVIGFAPEIYKSICDKVEPLCLESDLKEHNYQKHSKRYSNIPEGQKVVKLSPVRGNVGKNTDEGYVRHDDFYTWIPTNGKNGKPNFDSEEIGFGLIVDPDVEDENVYSYLRTYFARLCLALGKFNQSIYTSHCLKTTPYLDFHKKWTDEELFELAGFTDEELEAIYKVIPSYY